MLEPFLVAAATVFVAEFGDKSQLLAMMLAARFRNAKAVLAGAAVGVLANHAIAATLGALLARLVPAEIVRLLVAGGFLAGAALILFARDAGGDDPIRLGNRGAFLATAATLFLVEMGDKTQLAVGALSARFDAPGAVVAGAFVGEMLAIVPAVLFADRLLARLSPTLIRYVAATGFALVGIGTLMFG